mmetsp:Transcript_86634/g.249970  ORF Transcript_86634/g.249970 Transcript_86634/m.249970 type:complete len:318 (+) Transcript_86634:145-1098(+)
MRLYNIDVDEAERASGPSLDDDDDVEFEDDVQDPSEPCRTFFELRQCTLGGMDQMSAFRLVALSVVRKLRMNLKGNILYGEIEDALGRYFRILDADMQKFAALHEILRDAAEKHDPKASAAAFAAAKRCGSVGAKVVAEAVIAIEGAHASFLDAMREIAVVLLACGEMQRRALDLKMGAQRVIAEHREGCPCMVSFSRFADFLEEALAVCDQLRRKLEELHQQRIRAMALAAEARCSATAAGSDAGARAQQARRSAPGGVQSFTQPPRESEEAHRQAVTASALVGSAMPLHTKDDTRSIGASPTAAVASPRPASAAG